MAVFAIIPVQLYRRPVQWRLQRADAVGAVAKWPSSTETIYEQSRLARIPLTNRQRKE